MRILKVTQSYAPFHEFGGPPVKVRALAEGLVRLRHRVTVVTPDWGLEKRIVTEADSAKMTRSPFGWRREENGVEAIYLPTWARYRSATWNPAIHRYCRVRLKDFDLVHIFGLYDLLGPAVARACRQQGIPYVLEPIGMFLPIVRNLFLKQMYHAVWGRHLVSGARAVIATAQQEADELVSGGVPSRQIVLRRNGVEASSALPPFGTFRGEHGIGPNAKLVLFIGRLTQKKSPDLLLKAFANLPAEIDGNPLNLVFAGPDEDEMKSQLEKQAAKLNVASRVRLMGPVFADAKWAAYRDADVFVLPSQNENFGNTAAESIAAGTPAIVTDQCGVAPALKDAAGLVVPHDEAALTEALRRILSDSRLHQQLADGCSRVTSQLGWAEPVREMENLYRDVIAAGSAGQNSFPARA